MQKKSTRASVAIDALRAFRDAVDSSTPKVEKEGNLVKLLVYYFNLKEAHDELDALRKEIYAQMDRLNKVVVPKAIESSGMDKVQVPEVQRSFYTQDKYSASIVDKGAGYNWLRQHEAGALITETVNAGTLASFLKDYILEAGKDPPEDVFKFSTYQTTGMSRYTPKKGPVKKVATKKAAAKKKKSK